MQHKILFSWSGRFGEELFLLHVSKIYRFSFFWRNGDMEARLYATCTRFHLWVLGFSSEISTLPHFCFPFLTLLIQICRNEMYCLFEAVLGTQQMLVLYPNCLSLDKPIFQYYENWGKTIPDFFLNLWERFFLLMLLCFLLQQI